MSEQTRQNYQSQHHFISEFCRSTHEPSPGGLSPLIVKVSNNLLIFKFTIYES